METGTENKPMVDVKGKEIAQIGFVVHDAVKTAKRYSVIFGIGPWLFFDATPTNMVLHGNRLKDGDSCSRIALTNLGKMQIELIQPMYGESTYMEFLEDRGEGIHHVSFGLVDDHDQVVSAFEKNGMEIEMQGLLGGAYTFTYMATQRELGTIFEVVNPAPPGVKSTFKPWGTHDPQGSGLINMKGKEIVQIGVVVEDAEKTAKNYWEILGIGPWVLVDFKPPHVTDGILHGITMREVDFHVRGAIADHGNIQFELLQPIHGPGTHMEFLKMNGEGVNHFSFGEVDDHDEVVFVLGNQGIDVEMSGLLGGATTFTYMSTQGDLGTTMELLKVRPGVENSLVPYGTYPPASSLSP
jgi:hypothetical protein